MGEFKGTAGKWVVEDNCNGQTVITNEKRNKAICFVPDLNSDSKSNINLITSAPELMEALQWFIDSTYTGCSRQELDKLRIKGESAIKKALGL